MNRRGIALPMALLALLLATGLSLVALEAARRRMLSGTRVIAARRALEAARGAVERHAAEWDSTVSMAPLGVVVGQPSAFWSSDLVTHDSLVRLSQSLYLLRSAATVSSRGGVVLARDGVSRLVQVVPSAMWGDSSIRFGLQPWLYRNSRDNVAMMSGVVWITNGWAKWP